MPQPAPEHLRKCLAFIFLEREGTLVIASPQVGHLVLVVFPLAGLVLGAEDRSETVAAGVGKCSAKVGREISSDLALAIAGTK